MKADRTVIVFGAFLFLVGLAVAWNGYGYVQIERGWTLVISGTIGFCSGLILIALGLVLRELEAIASSAAQAALFLARARSEAQRVPEPAAFAEPPPAAAPLESQPLFEPEPAAVAEPAPPSPSAAFEPHPSFEPEPAAAAEPMAVFSPPPEEEPPAPEAPPLPENPASKTPGWMSRAGSYVASFAAARTKDEPLTAGKTHSDQSDDWLEQAIAEEAATEDPYRFATAHEAAEIPGPLEPEPAEEPAPVEYEREMQFEPEPETEPEPQPEQEQAPQAEHAPEPEHEHEPQPAPTETPAVVGHYEANGARYTMYADGSIDAETAHGVYRFASMEELKRFIETSA